MPEKRTHSPDFDEQTSSKHFRLEEILAPTVFQVFTSTCAAFQVQIDPDNHTKSYHTRGPNPYDKHLPRPLHLLKLTIDLKKIEQFNALCLSSQHWPTIPSKAVDGLRGSVSNAINTKVTNEDGVSHSARSVISHCLHLANLLLHGGNNAAYVSAVPKSIFSICTMKMDVEGQQLDHLTSLTGEKSFCLVAPSQKETIADGIAISHRKGDENVGAFMSFEFKNCVAFDPRVVFIFLLIVRVQIEDPQLDIPWPEPECNGCEQFKDCHEAWNILQSGVSAPDLVPRDSTHSKLPPSPDVKDIDRLLLIWRDCINDWDLAMGASRVRRRALDVADRPLLQDIHQAVSQAYDKAFDGIGGSEKAEVMGEKDEILAWLESAWLILVQTWAQGVHEDTSTSVLSSLMVSQYFLRIRSTQTAVLSEPNVCRSTIPSLIGAAMHGYNDASDRQSFRRCFDPFKKQTKVERKRRSKLAENGNGNGKLKDDDDDDGNDDFGGPQARFRNNGDGRGLGDVNGRNGDLAEDIHLRHLHLSFNALHMNLQSPSMSTLTRISYADMVGSNLTTSTSTTSNSSGGFSASGSGTSLSSTSSGARDEVSGIGLSMLPTSAPDVLQSGGTTSPSLRHDGPDSLEPPLSEPALNSAANPVSAQPSSGYHTKGGIILTDSIASGALGMVWSGILIVEGASQTHHAIVAKITTKKEESSQLYQEAMIYEDKAHLDLPVAHYYGLFKDCDGMTILLLEDVGVQVDEFDDISSGMKRKIYNAFCRLHDAGISHNDVEPRNILLTPSGEVKVVDFHVASEHKCPADGCDYYERISRYLNF